MSLNWDNTSAEGRLSIKMPSYQCREPHVKDKTARPFYLEHGNSHTWERRSFYWDRVLILGVWSQRLHYWSNPPTLPITPPKVLLLCRSWGACVPRGSQRLCQLEFWLLVGTTMLDRFWARGQTKCNTPLMLATSVFGRIHKRPCYVMAQPKSRLDIPWPNDAECMGHVWYHFSCWYPLLFDVESLAGCVGG